MPPRVRAGAGLGLLLVCALVHRAQAQVQPGDPDVTWYNSDTIRTPEQETGVCGWELVRYLPPNAITWFPGTGNLQSISASGTAYDYNSQWSIAKSLAQFDEVVASTCGFQRWVYFKKNQITNVEGTILLSSSSTDASYTSTFRSSDFLAMNDQNIWSENEAHAVYMENNWGSDAAVTSSHRTITPIDDDDGMCVFVRHSSSVCQGNAATPAPAPAAATACPTTASDTAQATTTASAWNADMKAHALTTGQTLVFAPTTPDPLDVSRGFTAVLLARPDAAGQTGDLLTLADTNAVAIAKLGAAAGAVAVECPDAGAAVDASKQATLHAQTALAAADQGLGVYALVASETGAKVYAPAADGSFLHAGAAVAGCGGFAGVGAVADMGTNLARCGAADGQAGCATSVSNSHGNGLFSSDGRVVTDGTDADTTESSQWWVADQLDVTLNYNYLQVDLDTEQSVALVRIQFRHENPSGTSKIHSNADFSVWIGNTPNQASAPNKNCYSHVGDPSNVQDATCVGTGRYLILKFVVAVSGVGEVKIYAPAASSTPGALAAGYSVTLGGGPVDMNTNLARCGQTTAGQAGCTATANSDRFGAAGNAVNGNTADYWQTDTSQPAFSWLKVDLQSSKTVRKVKLAFRQDSTTTIPNDGWKIRLGDNSNHADNDICSGPNDAISHDVQILEVSCIGQGQYISYESEQQYLALLEFEVYGLGPSFAGLLGEAFLAPRALSRAELGLAVHGLAAYAGDAPAAAAERWYTFDGDLVSYHDRAARRRAAAEAEAAAVVGGGQATVAPEPMILDFTGSITTAEMTALQTAGKISYSIAVQNPILQGIQFYNWRGSGDIDAYIEATLPDYNGILIVEYGIGEGCTSSYGGTIAELRYSDDTVDKSDYVDCTSNSDYVAPAYRTWRTEFTAGQKVRISESKNADGTDGAAGYGFLRSIVAVPDNMATLGFAQAQSYTPAPARRLYALEVAAAQTLDAPVAGTFAWASAWTVAAWLRAGAIAVEYKDLSSTPYKWEDADTAAISSNRRLPTKEEFRSYLRFLGYSITVSDTKTQIFAEDIWVPVHASEYTQDPRDYIAIGNSAHHYVGKSAREAGYWAPDSTEFSGDSNFAWKKKYAQVVFNFPLTLLDGAAPPNNVDLMGTADLTAGTWTHVALTHAAGASTAALHVGGAATGATVDVSTLTTDGGGVQITGAAVDDLRVFSSALTLAQVQAIAGAVAGAVAPPLQFDLAAYELAAGETFVSTPATPATLDVSRGFTAVVLARPDAAGQTGDLLTLKDASASTIAKLGADAGAVQAACPNSAGTPIPAAGTALHAQAEGLGVYALVASDTGAKVYAPAADGSFLHAGAAVAGCGGFAGVGAVADMGTNLARACGAAGNSACATIDGGYYNTGSSNLVDNDLQTDYQANAAAGSEGKQWAQINLGAKKDIHTVVIYTGFYRASEDRYVPEERLKGFQIYISDTTQTANSQFQVASSILCFQHPETEPELTVTVTCKGNAQYVILNQKYFEYGQFREVKIYGPTAGSATGALAGGYSVTLGGSAFAGLLGEAFLAPRALSRAELGLAVHGLAAYAGDAPAAAAERWYTFDGDLSSYHDRADRRRKAAEAEAAAVVDPAAAAFTCDQPEDLTALCRSGDLACAVSGIALYGCQKDESTASGACADGTGDALHQNYNWDRLYDNDPTTNIHTSPVSGKASWYGLTLGEDVFVSSVVWTSKNLAADDREDYNQILTGTTSLSYGSTWNSAGMTHCGLNFGLVSVHASVRPTRTRNCNIWANTVYVVREVTTSQPVDDELIAAELQVMGCRIPPDPVAASASADIVYDFGLQSIDTVAKFTTYAKTIPGIDTTFVDELDTPSSVEGFFGVCSYDGGLQNAGGVKFPLPNTHSVVTVQYRSSYENSNGHLTLKIGPIGTPTVHTATYDAGTGYYYYTTSYADGDEFVLEDGSGGLGCIGHDLRIQISAPNPVAASATATLSAGTEVYTPAPARRLYALEVAAGQTLEAPVDAAFAWTGEWTVAAWLRAGAGASGAVLSVVDGGGASVDAVQVQNISDSTNFFEYWKVDACPGSGDEYTKVKADPHSTTTGATCCQKSDGTPVRKDTSNNCLGCDDGNGCDPSFTFWEAYNICEDMGERICYEDELGSGNSGCSTGCATDNHHVWTIKRCDDCLFNSTWTHVALTYPGSATDVQLHVNGGAGASTGIDPSGWSDGGSVRISAAAVDDLRVYTSDLHADLERAGAPAATQCTAPEKTFPTSKTATSNTFTDDGYTVTLQVRSAQTNLEAFKMYDNSGSTYYHDNGGTGCTTHCFSGGNGGPDLGTYTNCGAELSASQLYPSCPFKGTDVFGPSGIIGFPMQIDFGRQIRVKEINMMGEEKSIPYAFVLLGSNDASAFTIASTHASWTIIKHVQNPTSIEYGSWRDASSSVAEDAAVYYIDAVSKYRYYTMVVQSLVGSYEWIRVHDWGFTFDDGSCPSYGFCDPDDPDAASCAALLPAIPGDTGGWRLVRYLPSDSVVSTGYNPGDDLLGTDLGDGSLFVNPPSPDVQWTKTFGTHDEILFVNGIYWTRTTSFDSTTDTVTEIQTVSHSSIASDNNRFWQAAYSSSTHPALAYMMTDGTWYSFYSEGSSMSGVSERKYATYIFVREAPAGGGGSTLSSGLRVHFPFSTDVNDQSGNNFHIIQESSGISHAFSNNYIFVGSATGASAFYGKLPNPTTVIPSGITTFTVSFWVDAIADSGGWKCLWRYGGDYIYYNNAEFLMNFQGKQVQHNGGAISTEKHITVTCDSDTYTYYVNGVTTAYTTSGTSTFGTSGYTAPSDGTDFDFFVNGISTKFIGKVKDFRMYDRVLTQSEIEELVAMGGASAFVPVSCGSSVPAGWDLSVPGACYIKYASSDSGGVTRTCETDYTYFYISAQCLSDLGYSSHTTPITTTASGVYQMTATHYTHDGTSASQTIKIWMGNVATRVSDTSGDVILQGRREPGSAIFQANDYFVLPPPQSATWT